MSSQVIKSMQKNGKAISIEYVDRTTAWFRPEDYPSTSAKAAFAQLVEEHIGAYKPETTRVALKYISHAIEPSSSVKMLTNRVDYPSIKVKRTCGHIIPSTS